MNWLWKTLLGLFVVWVGILVLVAAVAMSILNWPTLLLNEHSLEWLRKRAPLVGATVTWKENRVAMRSFGFLNERIAIGFNELCVAVPPTVEEICVDSAEIGFRYAFAGLSPAMDEIGPITITGGRARIRASGGEAKETKDDSSGGPLPLLPPEIRLPRMLQKTRFFPIRVTFDDIRVQQQEGTLSASVTLTGTVTDGHRLKAIALETKLRLPDAKTVQATAEVSSPSHFREDDWGLAAKADAGLPDGGRANVDATLTRKERALEADIRATLARGTMRGSLRFAGTTGDEGIELRADGELLHVAEIIPRIALANCRMTLTPKTLRRKRATLALHCPLDIYLQAVPLPEEVETVYHTPEQIRLALAADLDTDFPPDLSKRVKGDLSVDLTPVKSRIITNAGSIAATIDGVPDQFPTDWRIDTTLDIDFRIARFQELVALLYTTPFPVPAPFSVLQGSVALAVRGGANLPHDLSQIPVVLETRLRSPEQALIIDGKGKAAVVFDGWAPSSADVAAAVELSDIALTLPRIVPASMPRLVPDSRIQEDALDIARAKRQAQEEQEESAFDLTYDLTVKTPKRKPIRLTSNLTKSPIPIAVDMTLADGKPSGTITVEKFRIKLFRRNADVQKIALQLADPFGLSEVDGLITVRYVDYTINIELAGPANRPRIILTSDPPLSHEDIIATLIYGEPFSDLEGEDQESVGNMSSAVANRALALWSLYTFASTPIQRIGYDPETGAVSAKLRIAEGTSLTVGSNAGSSQEVGLRRRLGGGWIVSTTVEDFSDGESAKANAFLEWHKRY